MMTIGSKSVNKDYCSNVNIINKIFILKSSDFDINEQDKQNKQVLNTNSTSYFI